MQNPNFVFGKKKKTWVAKFFSFKNHVLGMKLKVSFSKRDFGKKHDKKMGYQTDPKSCLENCITLIHLQFLTKLYYWTSLPDCAFLLAIF